VKPFEKLKELWDKIDSARKGWALVVAIVSALVPLVGVRSGKMIVTAEVAVFLGASLSYVLTVSKWAGRPRQQCLNRRKSYLGTFWLPALLVLGMLFILEPDVAKATSTQRIRDLLISSSFLPNLIAFVGICLTVFLVVGAILLSSPTLWASTDT
jgi:hypothetical protein